MAQQHYRKPPINSDWTLVVHKSLDIDDTLHNILDALLQSVTCIVMGIVLIIDSKHLKIQYFLNNQPHLLSFKELESDLAKRIQQVQPSITELHRLLDYEIPIPYILQNNTQVPLTLNASVRAHAYLTFESEETERAADQIRAALPPNFTRHASLAIEHALYIFHEQSTSESDPLIEPYGTPQSQATISLNRFEELTDRLTAILNSNYDGIALTDTAGCIRQTNLNFDEMFGFANDQAFGLKITSLVDDTAAKTIEKLLQSSDKNRIRVQATAVGLNELYIPVDVMLSRIESASVQGFVASFHDITDIKLTEEQLRRSEAELRAVFESTTLGFIVVDHRRQIRSINSVAKEMAKQFLGTKLQIATPILQYIKTKYIAQFEQQLNQAFTGERLQIEHLQTTSNEAERWLDIRYNPIMTNNNEVFAVCITIDDITEQKQNQLILQSMLHRERELNELKSRFVTMVSHQIRTPLATIQATSNKLEHYYAQMTETQRITSFGKIQTQIANLLGLLDDVLFVGSVRTEDTDFSIETINIGSLIQQVISEAKAQSSTDPDIQLFIEAGCESIRAYRVPLHHILSHLLSNAIKYAKDHPQIEIRIACTDEVFQFTIEDHGIGIPLDDQELLFDQFHRASNVSNMSGTGLGLAVVKQAVELHHGEIAFKSIPNQGTTFVVTLPNKPKEMANEKTPDY